MEKKSILSKALDAFEAEKTRPLKYIQPFPNELLEDKKEPPITINLQETESSSTQKFVSPQKTESPNLPKISKEYEPAIVGMESGYIKIYRKVMDGPLWRDKPFARGQAWIDLCLLTNWTDKEWISGEGSRFIKRGQFFTSERKLAERWGWTRKKTQLFLKWLQQRNHSIEVKKSRKGTLITLINYGLYNPLPNEETRKRNHTRNHKGATEVATDVTQLIKDNKGKNKSIPQTPQDDDTQELFECFWENYPRKVEKKVALGVFKQLKKKDQALSIKCAMNYRDYCRATKTEEKFIKHAATFLGKDRWRDYLVSSKEKERTAFEERQRKSFEEAKK
jgi:hypothetical protein